uniref:Uncharacterized protein n=1 Tax=Anguilla anguilla TaxID=7936 RepID=A0A0E9SKD4_ANGAN
MRYGTALVSQPLESIGICRNWKRVKCAMWMCICIVQTCCQVFVDSWIYSEIMRCASVFNFN